MKWDRVMSGLFVGPDPRDDTDFEQLKAANITAILSLQTNDDLRDRGVDWEERSARAAEMAYRNVPVTDFDSADLRRKLPECVSVLNEMLHTGHSVYVHCTAGVSRSPTVVVAYLHWCLEWPLEEAVSHLKETRACTPNSEAISRARRPVP